MIKITENLSIPEDELAFTASRSGGPGGQHVNKVSSRVTLLFNVVASPSLSDEHKQRLQSRLATRMTKDGILRVVSQKHRSQMANRTAAIERFVALVQEVLAPTPERKPTAVPRAVQARRLEAKRQRGQLKSQRAARIPLEQ